MVLLCLTAETPDVVGRTVILGDEDAHDSDLSWWHFLLDNFRRIKLLLVIKSFQLASWEKDVTRFVADLGFARVA